MKISNSEIRAFKACRRKWYLTYYRKLRAVREGIGPLAIGNMVHSVLEKYYEQGDARDPEAFAWEPLLAADVAARLADERLPEQLHAGMAADADLARIMLTGYFDWLQDEGADSELEILAAEQEIEAYLDTFGDVEVYLIGKLDVLARMRSTGAIMSVDHKTVANMTDLPKIGELDEQLRMYGLLQRMAQASTDGLYASGGVWNMLRKVKRSARANPPFYARAGTSHNEEVYRTFHLRVWGEVRDMIRVVKELDAGADHQVVAYPNPGRDCTWSCPFFTVCARFDDGSPIDEILSDDYEVHDPYARYIEVEKS